MYSDKDFAPARGFTLTEAAIVLGIMGLILGAVWVAAGAVYKNQRVTTSSQQLLQIAQNVRSMHATQSTMADAAQSVWAESGVLPKDLVTNASAGTTVNAWGGNVIVNATNNGSTFFVSFANLPQDACTDFIVRNSGNGRDGGLIRVGPSETGGHAFADNNTSVSPTEALGYCNSTANEVYFVFNLKG